MANDAASDVRTALEAAYDAALPPEVAEPVKTEPAASETPPPADAAPSITDAPKTAERPRDEAGKFVKATSTTTATPEKSQKAVGTQAPIDGAVIGTEPPKQTTSTTTIRAPQSWTPAARESFAQAPPAVQAEVIKREREIAHALNESADAKRTMAQWREALTPFSQILGANALQTTVGIVQTAHALANAPPEAKAQIIARLIHGYQVPIEMLAEAIDKPSTGLIAQPQQNLEAVVERVIQQRLGSVAMQRAQSELEKFEATEPEFYEDVRDAMAGILEAGLASDYAEAYKKACQLNAEISGVLAQREQAQRAKEQLASTQRAREAASSIKPQPSGQLNGSAKSKDWREALEEQWDRHT